MKDDHRRLAAWSQRQQELHAASLRLFELLAVHRLEDDLLQAGIDALTTLVGAQYGAVGILDASARLEKFIHTGIPPAQVARIGRLPEGRGLLGVVIRENHSLRLDDMSKDSRAAGFPPYHPPMTSLLAVPIAHAGRVHGRVYLSDKRDGTPFSDDDERVVRRFADALALTLSFHRIEAQRQQREDELRELARALSAGVGDTFFRELVVSLCQLLGVDYAFVGECDDERPELVHSIAFCAHGRIADNITYRLAPGTPCGAAACREVCHFPDGVTELFPEDELLRRMQAAAFIGHPLLDAGGEPRGLLAVMHTRPIAEKEHVLNLLRICATRAAAELERRSAERGRSESEARFRALFEQAAVGVAQIDTRSGRFLQINRRYCDILGLSVEEAMARTFQSVTHPDDLEADLRNMQRLVQGEVREFSMDKRYLRKDGTTVWVQLTVSPMWAPGEAPRTHIAVVQDITARKQAEAEMHKLSSAIEQTADSVVITDRGGVIQYVNPAYSRITGYTRDEAVGRTPNLVKSGRHDPDFYGRLWNTILRGEVFRDVLINRRKDGSIYYEEKTITPLRDPHGAIVNFVSTGKDISARMRAEEALRASEASLARAQRIAHLGNWDWNIATGEVYLSDEIYDIVGLSPQAGMNYATFVDLVHADDREFVTQAVREAVEQGRPYNVEYRVVRPDAGERIVHSQGEIVPDERGRPARMIGTAQDITERKRTQEQLNYLAYYDTLTGLPNRVLLRDRLRQAMLDADRNEHLVAVMFLDLDRFKVINDTLGHDAGDALLKLVAERLQDCVRAGDTIARLGGDEFTIVLSNLGHVDDVTRVARKVMAYFAQPFQLVGNELFVTASVGITVYPFDDTDLDNLLKNADAAMYLAKEQGRNNFQFYTAELNARATRRLTLETALRRALERNELELHYQPQVDLRTGRVIGSEALLRWRHPELGEVSPVEFIPLAEETGLIVPIGEWVLRTACSQNMAWQAAGLPPMPTAVNLSLRQFQGQDLYAAVRRVLDESGLAPELLDLEMTESVLMHDAEGALVVIRDLKKLGVSFSLDDFGTGYSSLSYLKRFPIDTLKIDRSFVRDIPDDADDAAIAVAIIAMAHSLGIRVIAEGVETAAQVEFLCAHDCDAMQGYHFSRPVPATEMTDILHQGARLDFLRRRKARARRKR